MLAMQETTSNVLNVLLDSIREDERFIAFRLAETAMEEDEEVQALSKTKDEKAVIWEEARRYEGENSPNALIAQKELYLAKKALDEHPKVLQYRKEYAQIARIFEELDRLVLGDFKTKVRCHRD